MVRQSESSLPGGDEGGPSASSDSYEVVAPEYYQPEWHPTCADFRDASSALIRRVLFPRLSGGTFCEVGCGDSLLCDLLLSGNLQPEPGRIDLVDSSPGMLSYSVNKWAHLSVGLWVADARRLPFAHGSINVLISSLGDPYNDRGFWMEVARVLAHDGMAIFTTPSYEWANEYRSADDEFCAVFKLMSGSLARLASIILPPDDQVGLIESCEGTKLVVEEKYDFLLGELVEPRKGSKVMAERGPTSSVVTCYVVRRS